MSKTKQLVYAAFFIALGLALPFLFHQIPNGGSIFSPMHIPVYLSGLVLGPWYGLACGILTPLLSSVLTSMPPAAYLPGMLVELATYGLISGLMMKLLKTKNFYLKTITSLLVAMICGRIVGGLANALILRVGAYSWSIWLTSYFITGLPGIIIHIILIPLIMLALQKAKLI